MSPRLVILSVLVHVVVCLPHVQKIRYDGHKVLEILHNTEADFKKLLDLEVQLELDFWKLPRHQNDSTLINVAPHYMDQFLQYMKHYDMKVSSFIDDVQKFVEDGPVKQPTQHNFKRAQSSRSSHLNLDVYHTHATIRSYMDDLAHATLPNHLVVTVRSIGTSFEGREIEVLKIHSTVNNNTPKKTILIDGGIHAREWISPATVLYFIENLIYNPDNNPDIDAVLSAYDIELIPVLNPDGYEYTDIVRLWRKNRSVQSSSSCVGVDLNRNFPFHWNPAVGGSVNPCSDLFSGPGAESEPETLTLTRLLGSHAQHPSYIAYLTIHSYGQMWLYPWGYTSALPADWADLDDAAGVGMKALQRSYHTRYTKGSSTNVLYSAAGGSDDFAKGTSGVKYSYTVELRDLGRYGFQLPQSYIRPVGEETLEGFLAFALRVKVIEGF